MRDHPFIHLLWQFVAGLVVPESLAVEKSHVKVLGSHYFERLLPRRKAVLPGDLILVRTPGAVYNFFRRLSGHHFDHLAIVMEDGQFLHVGPPTIRLLPVELLLSPSRKPIVLRPKLTDAERAELIASLKKLVGQKYDTVRVYSFIFRLASHKYFGLKFPLRMLDAKSKSNGSPNSEELFICTDAILSRLIAISKDFRAASRKFKFDYSSLRSWSINDVQRLAKYRPRLLQKVTLPHVPPDPEMPLTPFRQFVRDHLSGPRERFAEMCRDAWRIAHPYQRIFIQVLLLTHHFLPLKLARLGRLLALMTLVRTLQRLRASTDPLPIRSRL